MNTKDYADRKAFVQSLLASTDMGQGLQAYGYFKKKYINKSASKYAVRNGMSLSSAFKVHTYDKDKILEWLQSNVDRNSTNVIDINLKTNGGNVIIKNKDTNPEYFIYNLRVI
jgi:hypothetical protein